MLLPLVQKLKKGKTLGKVVQEKVGRLHIGLRLLLPRCCRALASAQGLCAGVTTSCRSTTPYGCSSTGSRAELAAGVSMNGALLHLAAAASACVAGHRD